VKRPVKEYEALRREARSNITDYIERIRLNPRPQKNDHRIFAAIAEELNLDVDCLIRYTKDLVDEGAFVDYQAGTWLNERGEVYINPPHLAKIVGYTKGQIQYYLSSNNFKHIELLTNLPYNRVQKYYRLQDVCPPYCFLRYKSPGLTFKQFIVFFTIVAWKEAWDYWPTNRQVQQALWERHSLSLWATHDLIRKLQELGYMSIVYRNALRGPKEVVIHKGLERLPVSGVFRRNNKILQLHHGKG